MIYLVSFDPHKVDADKLHDVITEKAHIDDWWHYLGSTYLLSSSYSLSIVKGDIENKWPNQRYLIIKVDPNESNGWLPQKAWDWIKKYEK